MQQAEVSGSGYEIAGSIEFKGKKPEALQQLLKVGVLCNNSVLKDASVLGDPTEGCLLVSAAKGELDIAQINSHIRGLGKYPFHQNEKL